MLDTTISRKAINDSFLMAQQHTIVECKDKYHINDIKGLTIDWHTAFSIMIRNAEMEGGITIKRVFDSFVYSADYILEQWRMAYWLRPSYVNDIARSFTYNFFDELEIYVTNDKWVNLMEIFIQYLNNWKGGYMNES